MSPRAINGAEELQQELREEEIQSRASKKQPTLSANQQHLPGVRNQIC